jgi:glycosyltransferase involved in cell wall biosynthesis
MSLALLLRSAISKKYLEIMLVLDNDDVALSVENEQLLLENRIQTIRHHKNLGYEAAFLTCLSVPQTKYVLITPDDDMLIPSGIYNLIRYLEESNDDLIIADWLGINGEPMRRISERKHIRLSEIRRFVNHATGIVYRTPARLDRYKQLVLMNEYKSLRGFFPQVLLAFISYLEGGRLRTVNIVIGGYKSEGPKPSDLLSADGYGYSEPSSVLAIALDTINFFEKVLHSTETGSITRTEIFNYMSHLKFTFFTEVFWSVRRHVRGGLALIVLGLIRALLSSLKHRGRI